MSDSISLSPTRRTTVAKARRAAWMLIAAFVAFAAHIAVFGVLGGDYEAANQQLADRLGVGVNEVPAQQLAAVNQQFQNTPLSIAQLVWGVAAFGLFAAAVAVLARLAERGRAWRSAAIGFAAVPVVCWVAIVGLAWLLGTDAPAPWTFAVYDAAFFPLLAAVVIAGALALIALAAAMRPTGITPVLFTITAALAGLGAVAAATVGTPPIVALLAGLILGIGLLVRARS